MKRESIAQITEIALIFLVLTLLGCGGNAERTDSGVEQQSSESDIQTEDSLSDFQREIFSDLRALENEPDYKVMHSIDAIDLVSYFSGYYASSHPFPCIFFDPTNKKLTVSGRGYQQSFNLNQFDVALASYRSVLSANGYSRKGKQPSKKDYVWVDGKKMVYLDLKKLFPDSEELKTHFTTAQYNFLFHYVGGWQGFSYISGFRNAHRDFPLMVGVGYKEEARLRVLGKDIAQEFKFDQLDSAFTIYRDYVTKRTE